MRILILFLFLARIVDSQEIYFPYFYDSDEIVSTVDSLRTANVKQILIVRTERLSISKQSDDPISSLIIWPADSGYCYIKTICSNVIFLPFKTKLDSRVLDEETIRSLFMTKDEDIYKFVAPLTNANAIFYISNSQQGYFELSDNLNRNPITYVPNDSIREKSRRDWFDLVIKDFKKLDYSVKLSHSYDREKEMKMEK